ncbi:hypothetical protein Tco_0855315 [Tanacetum coccineum]
MPTGKASAKGKAAKADAATDDNAKTTSVHDDVGVPDAAIDDNAKVSDAAVDDNAKATSVYDDVGVPDAVADDNAKATSVCDDIDQVDVTANDNTKKDTKPEVTVVKNKIKKRMSKRQRQLPTSTRRHSKRHIQEVASAADNGEVVKENQLPDSHENLTRDSNTPKTRIHVLKDVLDYLSQAKKPHHWFPWGNGLNVDEKFWQSLVARDVTSRYFLTLSVVELWVQLMWHFRLKHADWAIFSPYYYNLPMPYDLRDWIFKDITYPVG